MLTEFLEKELAKKAHRVLIDFYVYIPTFAVIPAIALVGLKATWIKALIA